MLLGGRYDIFDITRDDEIVLVKTRTTNFRPFADFSLRTPTFLAELNLNRVDDRRRVTGAESDQTVRDNLTFTVAWTPEDNLPLVRLQHLRTNLRDGSRALFDTSEQLTQLFAEYQGVESLRLWYRGAVQKRDDHITGNESTNTTHSFRADWFDQFWRGRWSVGGDYNVTWRGTETVVSGEGDVDLPVLPVGGLSSLDDTPMDDPLGPNPALVDGNRAASAGINLGLPPPGGDDRPRNFGLDFGDPKEVNVFWVWVDRELEPQIAASYAWTVWSSEDNERWSLRQTIPVALFGPFVNRFEIELDGVVARYIKLVVEPLQPSVPDAQNWPDVFVTELEAIVRRPADEVRGEFDDTFQTVNANSRLRLLERRAFFYELNYFARGTSGEPSTWTLSNGLSFAQPFGGIYSFTTRASREDGLERGIERTALKYSASLQAVPTQTLRYNLVLSGIDQDREEITDDRTSLYLYTNTELYRGVDLNVGVGRTFTDNSLVGSVRSDQVNAVATLVPHRWVILNLLYQGRFNKRWRGDVGLPDDFNYAREAALTFTPMPTVFFYGSYRVEERTDIARRFIRRFEVNWSPFPYGTLHVFIRYNEAYRSDLDRRERIVVPSVRWDITPRWFLQASFQSLTTESPLERNERNLLTATTRINF
jgi:hypothetical protein